VPLEQATLSGINRGPTLWPLMGQPILTAPTSGPLISVIADDFALTPGD
jgi:hypothetical protein